MTTITGWVLLLGGLYRMVLPEAPQAHGGVKTYEMLAFNAVFGLFLAFKPYGPKEPQS